MKKLLFWVVFALCSPVFAAAPTTQYYLPDVAPNNYFSSPAAACTQGSYGFTYFGDMNCQNSGGNSIWLASKSRCADGSAPNTALPSAQQCPDPGPDCQAGRTTEKMLSAGTRTANGGTTDMAAPTNISGCTVSNPELLGCYSTAAAPNTIMCRWRVTETGESSGSASDGKQPVSEPTAPSPEKTVPPFNPAQGQGCPKGTVNMGTDSSGGSICGGTGSAPGAPAQPPITTKPPVTTTNPDGSTTKTETTERANSDGSTTTTTRTTTTKADGTQTVSEGESTGKNASGGTGKKDATKDEIKDDFCKQHPELNVCKNSSVKGSCESVSCEGDAIQCAILRQQMKEYCENTKEDSNVTLGKQLLSGSDPIKQKIDEALKGKEVDLSAQSLDQSGFIGGGTCFPEKTITVAGHSIAVSFTSVCNNIQPLRYAVIACSLIVAYLLVSKSVLQG